jgi:hypothetical protein
VTENERPLAVRVLRFAGIAALVVGVIAFGIGALLRFDELAKIWAAIGSFLLAIGVTALLGVKPSKGGLLSGMVACLLMLVFPPVGTLVTAVIAIIASQSWPQLREYYRLRRSPA